jgi:integrase
MPRKKKKDKEWPAIRFHEPRNSWVVDAGTKLSEPDPKTGNKKRVREYYKTKGEAENRADQMRTELKNYGIKAFKLTNEQRIDAEKALKITEPLGISLFEAVSFYAEYHELKGAEMSFAELVSDHYKKLEADRVKGQGVADRTLSDYKSRHQRLSDEFGEIKLISFSHIDHWEPFSRKLGTSARRYENHLRILFNYAVERGYLKTTPMIGKLSDAPMLKKPAILREDQWRQLLLTAIATEKELGLLGYVVLILYMGLRPESEVTLLNWSNINLKTRKLFIGDDQTGKSFLGRTLKIPDVAINLFRICKSRKGAIIKSKTKHKKNWEKLRVRAGFIEKNKEGRVVRNDWVPDIARHTAGSMVYAVTQSKEEVRSFLGHTNDVTMRHYINHGESIEEEAERFYSFTAPLSDSEELKITSA